MCHNNAAGAASVSEEVRLQVLKTGGNMHLGGEDFDQKIMDWFLTVPPTCSLLLTARC